MQATVFGTSHDCLAITLRGRGDFGNGKVRRSCEEAVEARIFLWKEMENWAGNSSFVLGPKVFALGPRTAGGRDPARLITALGDVRTISL